MSGHKALFLGDGNVLYLDGIFFIGAYLFFKILMLIFVHFMVYKFYLKTKKNCI